MIFFFFFDVKLDFLKANYLIGLLSNFWIGYLLFRNIYWSF